MNTVSARVFDLLEENELNWSVGLYPLAPVPFVDENGNFIEVSHFGQPESNGIYRKDNGAWLGTVGNQYSTLQNSELAEIFFEALDAIGHGDSETRGGALFSGRKIYMQAKVPQSQVGGETLKRWITALNSHDGSTGVGFGATNTVVSCSNTFHHAIREVSKVRHSGDVRGRVKAMADNLAHVYNQEGQLVNTFRRMNEEIYTPTTVNDLINEIFEVDGDTKLDDLSTRKRNQIQQFSEAMNKETKEKGKTVWGLFNGVTYYTNHMVNVRAGSKGNDRQSYLMDGSGYHVNNKAFKLLTRDLTVELN